MQQSTCLILLLALSGSRANDINGKEIDSGLLVLPQSIDLQNENAYESFELKERLEYFLAGCLSLLPDITKKKTRQGLQETISAVSTLVFRWPLDGNLRDLKRQQGEVVRLLFRAQEEWQYWAEDKVLMVSKSSQYRGSLEALNITEEVNERYSLKLRRCARNSSGFILCSTGTWQRP